MRDIIFRAKRTDNGEWVEGRNISAYENPNTEKREFYIVQSGTGFAAMFDNDTGNITTIVFANTDNCMQKVDSETVGQFTGLTDKNGKKIFEGDIVKCRHRLVKFYLDDIEKAHPRRSYGKEIVETDSYGFSCFYWRNYAVSFRDGCIRIQNGSDHHEIRTNYIYNHEIEVIGNIHDNPELLEG